MHCSCKKNITQVNDKRSMPLAAVLPKKVINDKTSEEQEDIFSIEFGALICNEIAVCHGRSRNLLYDFTKIVILRTLLYSTI